MLCVRGVGLARHTQPGVAPHALHFLDTQSTTCLPLPGVLRYARLCTFYAPLAARCIASTEI